MWSYRAAITIVASSFAAGTVAAIGGDADWAASLWGNGTWLAAAGGAGMVAAVTLIHIYATPIKQALQVGAGGWDRGGG